MRRTVISVLVASVLVGLVPSAAAGGTGLDRPLRLGSQVRERWAAWVFGSSTAPFLQEGFCGEQRGTRFFLNAAGSPGTQVAHCEIPAGTPIIMTPGGGVSWTGDAGTTDAELLDAAAQDFSTISDPRVVLDGRRLPVGDAYASDVFRIRLHPGNFIQVVDPSTEGLDSVRAAFVAYFLKVALSEGDHTLILRDTITPPGEDPLRFRYRFEIEAT